MAVVSLSKIAQRYYNVYCAWPTLGYTWAGQEKTMCKTCDQNCGKVQVLLRHVDAITIKKNPHFQHIMGYQSLLHFTRCTARWTLGTSPPPFWPCFIAHLTPPAVLIILRVPRHLSRRHRCGLHCDQPARNLHRLEMVIHCWKLIENEWHRIFHTFNINTSQKSQIVGQNGIKQVRLSDYFPMYLICLGKRHRYFTGATC